MKNYINGIDFHELPAQKYWSFPSGYKKDAKLETKNMIFGGDYIGARKMDGAFYKFLKDEDGNMELIGRSKSVNGGYLNKIEWVPQLHEFFNALPNGTCLLGEIYFPNNEGSSNVTTIMGCLKDKALARQEKGNKLHYYVFDVLAWSGKSIYTESMDNRSCAVSALETNYKFDYVEFAQYYEGKELWENLQSILLSGGEGVVITKRDTCYQPGKRPARQTLKVKKEIQQTIDCFFTGHAAAPTKEYTGKEIESWRYWLDTQNNEKLEGQFFYDYCANKPIIPITKSYYFGWAGSLEVGVVRGEEIVPIGWLSGLTEEVKENWKDYKGKCVEITCMEILPTGGLRHAKLVQFRPDLTIRECSWEKIFGE